MKFEELDLDKVFVKWVEPFTKEKSLPVFMFVSARTAIEATKEAHGECSDQVALEEFIIVNWGSLHEGIGGKQLILDGSEEYYDVGDPWAV